MEAVMTFTIEEIANANGLTPFEFLQKAYEWRWGRPGTAPNIQRDLSRIKTGRGIPEYLEKYLKSFATAPTLPTKAYAN